MDNYCYNYFQVSRLSERSRAFWIPRGAPNLTGAPMTRCPEVPRVGRALCRGSARSCAAEVTRLWRWGSTEGRLLTQAPAENLLNVGLDGFDGVPSLKLTLR